MNQRRFVSLLLLSAAIATVGACQADGFRHANPGEAPPGLEWTPDSGAPFFGPTRTVTPYTGSEAAVLEAQTNLPTGIELQAEVVIRSCGPINGVCHNEKEYPDLHTPANFASTIGAPCNVQSGTPEGVFDRCERTGDRFTFDNDQEVEIGWVEYIAPPSEGEIVVGPDMPGLHMHFTDPVSTEYDGRYTVGRFVRTFVQAGNTIEDLTYFRYEQRFRIFDEGRHVVAEVPGYLANAVQSFMASGIEQGDLNRNGTYGARPNVMGVRSGPISLITAGDPETSYIIGRLRGHMEGTPVPGTRMPLANEPFSVAEMLALFCFVEGLDPAVSTTNLFDPIDYNGCSYAQNPALLDGLAVEGSGTGFATRIRPLLEANCSGCHEPLDPEEDLILQGSGLYERLMQVSAQDPMGRPLIDPGNLANSYLWLKLIGDPSIDGERMPVNPIAGGGALDMDKLDDIRAWIEAGAPND
jgi:hypothetical protein